MSAYVPLWVKSHFSLLEGASSPEELLRAAAAMGLSAIAITDRNSLAGAPRAAAAARDLGIKLIYGAELELVDGRRLSLLAKDRAGYGRLSQLISRGRLRAPKGEFLLHLEDLPAAAPGCIALLGGDDGWFGAEAEPDPAEVALIKKAFGDDLAMRISEHRSPACAQRRRRLQRRARRFGLPMVAANEQLYHDRSQRQLQDILTCVRHGCTLEEAGDRLRRNDQHAIECGADFAARFPQKPAWLAHSVALASRCNFDLFELRYRYPCERLPRGISGSEHLSNLAHEGAMKRYKDGVPEAVMSQLQRELSLVSELEYEGYFLTMWEIVRFCRAEAILCQGRGSAANSALCFCLGITAVDPMRHELLFERFLSRERAEPPDIDLDIAHERREEVIQHVYEKYGRRHAAMVSVNIRYRRKSAIRDAGKVLNIPQTYIDALAKFGGGYGPKMPKNAIEDARLPADDPQIQRWVESAMMMLDTPRHSSIHPGGFLLGHQPVDSIVPIENGAMADRTVIQWDKDDVETLGLFKVDLLGLGMLSQLARCFDLMRRFPTPHSRTIVEPDDHDTMALLPSDDPATYEMLSRGDSLGVFQVESRAQMNMLPRLRPRCFYDLVVEVAIVRPGPIAGDMVHPYLRRRDGLEPVVYPHACLEPVLRRTLGVPLFQEQVMRIAMVAAGYSPGEADQLRRDMAAWKRGGRIGDHRQRLIDGMGARGVPQAFAERVFEQVKGFGEYGFPESHAASFAQISYATAYLKRHEPAHFYAALLNAQPMGFYSVSTLVYGAQREGVELRPVDLRFSGWEASLEAKDGGYALRMGLRSVRGLGRRERQLLEAAGAPRRGEDLGLYARRTGLDRGALEALGEAGAFDAFGPRRDVLWQLSEPGLSRHEPMRLPEAGEAPQLPALSPMERIAWDQRRSRHSARGHPMALLRPRCQALGLLSAEALNQQADKRRAQAAGLVICRQRPRSASGVTFATLEDETGFINLVIFKQVAERYRRILKGSHMLAAAGRVQHQAGITHLIVHRLWQPEFDDAPVQPVPSYDYR